jgi:ectoine hydroxylase-related dioxygenase (phytanoyl-CoA dioxygenase family)
MVTAADIEQYQRNGAVRLQGAFEVEWLNILARGVDKNFRDPSPDGCRYSPEGAPGGFYDDYCNWTRIDEYRDFIEHSPAATIVATLMGASQVRIFHEHVLVKEPGTEEPTPWHQDLPYYCVDGTQICSIWLPLDPVPRSVCPQFVAGSHAWGRQFYPRKFVDHEAYGDGIQGYEPVPDIDGDPDAYELLSWDLGPGDCIVFHALSVHGAPHTKALRTRRRGFSTRWLGDDVVFATRPWTTSPPFRGVELSPGSPMEHPLFPLIRRRMRR